MRLAAADLPAEQQPPLRPGGIVHRALPEGLLPGLRRLEIFEGAFLEQMPEPAAPHPAAALPRLHAVAVARDHRPPADPKNQPLVAADGAILPGEMPLGRVRERAVDLQPLLKGHLRIEVDPLRQLQQPTDLFH